ncbi:unnamed protein product, partial [Adineta steineri]
FQLIIKNITGELRLEFNTLLELLYIKLNRNEIEHDSIKNFLRYNANGNSSFNSYLNSMGTDVDKYGRVPAGIYCKSQTID